MTLTNQHFQQNQKMAQVKYNFRFAFYSPTVFGPNKYKSLPPTIQMMKSFFGWPRTKLFHKNKDHHSSQTKQMIPDIFIVIERRKEC